MVRRRGLLRPILLGLLLFLVILTFYRSNMFSGRSPAVSLPATVLQIQQLHELATVKYRVQKVIGIKEPRVFFGEESLLLVVQGTVVAGIDLRNISEENVFRESDGRLLVKLPPPGVLHAYLDEKQTKVWDRRVTWWTPWVPFSPELETRARQLALKDIEETALEMGILQQAEQSTRLSIQMLLRSLGVETVRFEPLS